MTHVTSSYALRDIVEGERIFAQGICPVIGEDVTYAFYGRAAFRSGTVFKPTSLISLFPSVLILDPTKVPRPKYVFGFDSGAFVEGLMDQYLHPYMPLFDFLLTPDPISAAKLVHAIFDTDENYLRNSPARALKTPAANFEAECYSQIVLANNGKMDDRASTPELIFDQPLALSECVRAAVLPDTLASDPDIGNALRERGVTLYEYIWTRASRPAEVHFTIRNLVESAYRNLKWL